MRPVAEVEQELGTPRIVLGAVVLYLNPQGGETRSMRGDTVRLTPREEARLDLLGVLAPAGVTMEQASEVADHRSDLYRGQRGDQEAYQRALQRAQAAQPPPLAGQGIETFDSDASGSLADWIRTSQPTIQETVEVASGDPVRARAVLEAEGLATGGAPRKGVVEGLQKIIDGA